MVNQSMVIMWLLFEIKQQQQLMVSRIRLRHVLAGMNDLHADLCICLWFYYPVKLEAVC